MKYITILGALAVLVSGFVYFTLFSSPAHNVASQVEGDRDGLEAQSVDTEIVFEAKKGSGTLEELRRLSQDSMECTITYEPESGVGTVEGTYFVSDGHMRADFLTDSPDLSEKVLSSMIVFDEIMYVWSEIDGQLYGFKTNLSSYEQTTVETNEPVSLDAEVQYDCKQWKQVDNTVFEPPRDVLFQDVSDIMQSGMEYGTVYE